MNAYRDSTICISSKTRWKLARIVAATQPTGLENRQTVDSIAEKILDDWITEHFSALHELWTERESINDKAARAVNEKKI